MGGKKLIIYETDCHGCGKIYFDNKSDTYSYDDGCFGDVRSTIEELIKIGFIDPDDVAIFTQEDDNELFKIIEKDLKGR